ncbi:MAG: hypothetical protein PHV36_01955 [Elusimicrobiales bacterium]|nr:hypothetical protein [Elusimicrobiales bacterium]
MKSEVLILVAGRGAQAVLTIAAFRLLTTFLSPADVGNTYLILSMATLFGMFLLSPVCIYLNRKLFFWHDSKSIFDHLLGYNLFLLGVSVLAFITVWLSWRFFGIGAGLSGLSLALIVSFYVYALNWNQIFIPFLNALGHKVSFVLLTLATAGLGLLFSVIFIRVASPSAVVWMSGQVAAMALVTVLGAYVFRKKVREPRAAGGGALRYVSKAAFSNIAVFAVPLAGATFFMWAQGQSYRLLVEKINGAEFLGYLAVGFSIATSVAGILESLVQQIYMPPFYRRISGGDKDARRAALIELVSKVIPVYIIYLFFIIGSSEYLTRFLVAPKYHSVFVYARYGAFMEFFRMTTNILTSGAHSEMRTRALVMPYLLGGVAAIAGVYFAALSPDPSTLVPSVLAVCGLITTLGMWRVINSMVGLSLETGPILKALFLSALFLPLVLFHAPGFLPSLGMLSISVLYFSFLQYRVASKWLGEARPPEGNAPQYAAGGELSRTGQDL